MKKLQSMLLTASLAAWGSAVFADDNSDSNADAGQVFATQLEGSQGVVVRVPLTEDGREDSTSAEMKVLLSNSDVTTSEGVAKSFENGLDAAKGAVLPVDSDSNTSNDHHYGWNSWNNYGQYSHYNGYSHHDSYYYNNYRPYYHCGSSYNYNYIRPVYHDYSWGGYGHGGVYRVTHYHYYYYHRGW